MGWGRKVGERGRKGEESWRRRGAHAKVAKSKCGRGGKPEKEKSAKHDLFATCHFSHPCHRMYPDVSTSAASVPVADRYRILPTVSLVLFNILTRPLRRCRCPGPAAHSSPRSLLVVGGPPWAP